MKIPYILWDKHPEVTKTFLEARKDNKILETASFAIQAANPHPDEQIVIPFDLKVSAKGYKVVCQKVYLVGSDLLILSRLEGRPGEGAGIGRIRDRFVMKRPFELKEGLNIDFTHFLIAEDIERFEDMNGIDDMAICHIEDEEQFYHHLNLCAQIPDYAKLLKEKIHRDKLRTKMAETAKEEQQTPPPKKWGWLKKVFFPFSMKNGN